MSRGPKYPLEAVLELRQRAQDAAQEDLAAAIEAVEKAQGAVAEAEAEVERRRRTALDFQDRLYEPNEGGTLSIADVDRRRAELKVLERKVEAAVQALGERRAELESAESRVEEAREALTQAAKELKAIEKHQAKWKEDLAKEAQRKEEALMQEVASAGWLARRREAEGNG